MTYQNRSDHIVYSFFKPHVTNCHFLCSNVKSLLITFIRILQKFHVDSVCIVVIKICQPVPF